MPVLLSCCLGHDDPPVLVAHLRGFPDLVRCPRCSLIFLREAPTPEGQQAVSREYAQSFIEFAERFKREAMRTMERVQRFRQPPGRLLDVGSGPGFLLWAAKQRGWEGVGVESSPDAVAWGRKELGVDLRVGDAEQLSLEGPFDLIILSHILEHLRDPKKTLQAINPLLSRDSLVIASMPNWNGMLRRLMGTNWPLLAPQTHLWHFNSRTVNELFQRAGLRITKRWTEPGFMRPALGFQPTPQMLLKEFVKTFYVFHWFGLGDAMTVVASSDDGGVERHPGDTDEPLQYPRNR